jgi:hypothetical protein
MQYQSPLSWRNAVSIFLAMALFITKPLCRDTMYDPSSWSWYHVTSYVYFRTWDCALCPASALWSHVVQFRNATLCGSRLVQFNTILYESSGVWYRVISIFLGCGAVLYPSTGVWPKSILLWRQRAVPTFHCLSAALHDVTLMKVAIMFWASKQTKVDSHRRLLQTVRMSCSTDADQSYTYFPLYYYSYM